MFRLIVPNRIPVGRIPGVSLGNGNVIRFNCVAVSRYRLVKGQAVNIYMEGKTVAIRIDPKGEYIIRATKSGCSISAVNVVRALNLKSVLRCELDEQIIKVPKSSSVGDIEEFKALVFHVE